MYLVIIPFSGHRHAACCMPVEVSASLASEYPLGRLVEARLAEIHKRTTPSCDVAEIVHHDAWPRLIIISQAPRTRRARLALTTPTEAQIVTLGQDNPMILDKARPRAKALPIRKASCS